jgi:hypothetical protein
MATSAALASPLREFTIDRRRGLSYKAFVSEYLMPQKPVIITDGVKEWPALNKWTPEFSRRITVTNRSPWADSGFGSVISSMWSLLQRQRNQVHTCTWCRFVKDFRRSHPTSFLN